MMKSWFGSMDARSLLGGVALLGGVGLAWQALQQLSTGQTVSTAELKATHEEEVNKMREELEEVQAMLQRSQKIHSDLTYKTMAGIIGGLGPEAGLDFLTRCIQAERKLFVTLKDVRNTFETKEGDLIGDTERKLLLLQAAGRVSSAPWTGDQVQHYVYKPRDIAGSRWTDQQHVPFVMFNASTVPSRTHFLLGTSSADPTIQLAKFTRSLQAAGATIVAIPCNTAHAFIPRLREIDDIHVNFLHMPELTLTHAARSIMKQTDTAASSEEGVLTLGLLSTAGTIQTRVYHKAARVVESKMKIRIRVLTPGDVPGGDQTQVSEAIFGIKGIKAGCANTSTPEGQRNVALLRKEAEALRAAGARGIIMGCTEIPLVLSETDDPTLINPTQVLADALVHQVLIDRY